MDGSVVRVWTDGCFDMMHYGHANALRQAKQLGDVLVVGVHSDAEILKHKGPPVMREEWRYEAVEACKWADEVVRDAPYVTTLSTLDSQRCDFSVHGDDITTDAHGVDSYAEVKSAGRYREVKRTKTVSTTDMVGRMLLCTKSHYVPARAGASTLDALGPKKRSTILEMNEVKHSPYTSVSSFVPTTMQIMQFASGCRERLPTDRVVFIDGAWDLFHIGHIRAIREARKLGTYLIVGVLDDQTVNSYRGGNLPIMNVYERVLTVMGCRYVDEVVIGSPLVLSRDFIDSMRISAVVHGRAPAHEASASSAAADAAAVDFYKVPKELGIYHQVDSQCDVTTSLIIDKILENRRLFEERNRKKEEKELARMAFIEQQQQQQ